MEVLSRPNKERKHILFVVVYTVLYIRYITKKADFKKSSCAFDLRTVLAPAMDNARPMEQVRLLLFNLQGQLALKLRLQQVECGISCGFLGVIVRQMPHASLKLTTFLVDKLLEQYCGEILRASGP